MKKIRKMKYFSLLILFVIIISCSKDNHSIIAKNRLGNLTNTTKISEIKKILKEDSTVIVYARNPYGQNIASTIKEVKVYDTSGQEILVINPSAAMDSVSLIKNIRILSDKYKTANGLSLGSTFAEIKKHHNVSNIQSSLQSVILTLKELNAFVSFDKEVLSGEVRFDMDAEIKPTMIPDDAKINRFWLNFDATVNAED